MLSRFLALTFLAGLSFVVAALVASAEDLDFNHDIRPILSDKCYFCHGPDHNTREADLRLDSHDEAIDAIESGELVDRITSDDPDVLMPPPHSKIELTEQEKETIQTWIDQGAAYKGHWAFELLPDSVDVPSVSEPDCAANRLIVSCWQSWTMKKSRPIPKRHPYAGCDVSHWI